MKESDQVNLMLEIEHMKEQATKDRKAMDELLAWKAHQEQDSLARIGQYCNELNEYFIKRKATISEVLAVLTMLKDQHSRAFVEGKAVFQ